MTKCEITPRPLPTTLETSGLKLRVGPPVLTVETLRQLEAEARSQGKSRLLERSDPVKAQLSPDSDGGKPH
jgi:hypothetical protein